MPEHHHSFYFVEDHFYLNPSGDCLKYSMMYHRRHRFRHRHSFCGFLRLLGLQKTGWHPNDLCYKIPILKTEEEFWEWDGRSESTTESVNEVKNVPNAFKQWIGTNSQRIADAKRNGTLPYFLKDNPLYLK